MGESLILGGREVTGLYGTEWEESSALGELGQDVAAVVAIAGVVQKLIFLSTLLEYVFNTLLKLLMWYMFPAFFIIMLFWHNKPLQSVGKIIGTKFILIEILSASLLVWNIENQSEIGLFFIKQWILLISKNQSEEQIHVKRHLSPCC